MLCAGPLRAQSDSLRAVLDRTPPDERVRLELRGAEDRLVGLVRRSAGDSLLLRSGSRAPRTISVGRVSRLWTDDGTHAGRAALLGAAIGGGGGALVGFILFASDDSNETGVSPLQGGLLLGAIAGAPASLGGAVIGTLLTDWRLRYTSNAGPGVAVQVPFP